MTEPATTSLTLSEYQALCHGGASQLANIFAISISPSEETFKAAAQHMDRLRMFMRAWEIVAHPELLPAPMPTGVVERHEGRMPGSVHQVTDTGHQSQAHYAEPANGAAPLKAKRKGGRPKGSKNKPKQVEAVQ